MSKTFVSTIGALVAAATLFASPVLAAPGEGDYYQGANRHYERNYGDSEQYRTYRGDRYGAPVIDRFIVNSIFGGGKNVHNGGEGDYYQGPNRN